MSIALLTKQLARKELVIPLLKAFLAAENVKQQADPAHRHRIVVEDCTMSIKAFSARRDEYEDRKNKPIGQYFHPSALGVCLRRMFLGAVNAPVDGLETGTDLLRSYMILEIGTYYHVMVQNLLERAGLLVAREVPVMSESAEILGHGDGKLYIFKGKYLFEFKTINSRQFAMLHDIPKEEHKKQVHAYMRVLKMKACIILYCNKDTGQLKEYLVRYDRPYYKLEVRKRVKKFFRSVRDRIMPAREGHNERLFPCSYCEFRRVCWDTMVQKPWMKKRGIIFPPKYENKGKKEKLYA